MMLSKEECLEAFDHILFCDRDKPHSYISDAYKHDFNTLHRLMEEHFDNPPLKFEEIKKGMWIWDNKEGQWLQISTFLLNRKNKIIPLMPDYVVGDMQGVDTEYLEWEENRFYKREVR